MSISVFQIGDEVRLQATFTDAAGDVQDPGGVTFAIRAPDGTVTEYIYGVGSDVVRESAGIYYVDWITTAAGRYRYRFRGTTSGQAAGEREFRVQPSGVN